MIWLKDSEFCFIAQVSLSLSCGRSEATLNSSANALICTSYQSVVISIWRWRIKYNNALYSLIFIILLLL